MRRRPARRRAAEEDAAEESAADEDAVEESPAEAAASCIGVLKQNAVPRAAIACPRCASENTECISRFGSTPCKAAYRCRDCLEPFDYFKPF